MPFPGGKIAPALLTRPDPKLSILGGSGGGGGGSSSMIITPFAPTVIEAPSSGFINGRTLIAPHIVEISSTNVQGTGWGLWGRLNDNLSLGKYNGYINFTDDAVNVFPWTRTLAQDIVHFTPRLDYDEDDYWYRVRNVDGQAPGVSQSYFLIQQNVWTPGQTWSVIHTAGVPNIGGWLTMQLDWSKDSGATIFASIFIRFIGVA